MAEYIDRQAVIDIVRGYGERFNNHIGTLDDSEVYAYARGLILSIESNICGVPSADVQPVRHGRWVIRYGDGHTEKALTGGECSECGFVHTATKYCPNCGARMDGERK